MLNSRNQTDANISELPQAWTDYWGFFLGKFLLNVVCCDILYCNQEAKKGWSDTLWSNLDMKVLTEGIEEYIRMVRKMPKDMRQLPLARVVDEMMKEFRDSLPLFVDLKHEALRPR